MGFLRRICELFVRTYLRACGLGLTNIFQTAQQKDKLGRGGTVAYLQNPG